MNHSSDAPLVSVLCICGDHVRFVGECLRSLDAQTWPNLEILLLDNASTDGSRAVIESWAATTSRRHQVIYQDRKEGVCRNFNTLFARSTGEYFSLLAADDALLPEKFERQVGLLRSAGAEVGVVYSDAYQIDEAGLRLPGLFVAAHRNRADCPEGEVLAELMRANWIPALAALTRRSAWEKCGPWDEALVYEDWDMWLRLAVDYRFVFDPVPSALYRIVATSLTRSVLHRSPPEARLSVALIKARAASVPAIPPWERCRLLAGALEEVVAMGEAAWPGAEAFQWLFDRSGEPSFLAAARGHSAGPVDAAMLSARASELRRLESLLRSGGKAVEARRVGEGAIKRDADGAEEAWPAPLKSPGGKLRRLLRSLVSAGPR